MKMWFLLFIIVILILPVPFFLYYPFFWWFLIWLLLPLPWYYRPVKYIEVKETKPEYKKTKLRFV